VSVLSSRSPEFWYDVSTKHTIGSIRNKGDVNVNYKKGIEAKKSLNYFIGRLRLLRIVVQQS
jgi:hypothetical protein